MQWAASGLGSCAGFSGSPLLPALQLWYFWRRRLFIWISFMDSYFEILLYVGSHLLLTSPQQPPICCLLKPGEAGVMEGSRLTLGDESPGAQARSEDQTCSLPCRW